MVNVPRHFKCQLLASAFVKRLSKHIAVLVCLLILGGALTRERYSQLSIFGLAVISAMLNLSGRALRPSLGGHDRRTAQARKDCS
jgi:hypothetical protein